MINKVTRELLEKLSLEDFFTNNPAILISGTAMAYFNYLFMSCFFFCIKSNNF